MHIPLGNTPLIPLSRDGTILGKAEWRNPAGSVKDRIAMSMLRSAREQGALRPGGTVVEATSGNTGIALAALCAEEGFRCVIVMPADSSRERRALLGAYGAQVELTDPDQGMAGAIARAKQIAEVTPGSYYTDQFTNPANPAAHYAATGPEIWLQTDGKVDFFLAGVGTGGTVTGTGRYLKQRNPDLKVFAVTGKAIAGLGAGFSPPLLAQELIDGWIRVSASEAGSAVRSIAREQGLLLGISSGAAVCAARRIAEKFPGKTVVTVLPDSGERYLSTGIFG